MKLSKLIHTLSLGRYHKKEEKMSEVQITEDTTKADARKVNSGKRYPKEVKDEVIAFIKSKAVEVDGKYIVPRGTYKQGYAKFGMSYLTQTKLFRKAYPNV